MTEAKSLLKRAFYLLNAFSAARPELTLSELVEGTGLPRSTVHRLARQLEAEGALESTRRGWCVGVRMFELGQLVPTQRGLREVALPHMEDLYEATHETVHLAVLDGDDVLYVEVLSGHRKVRSPSRRGGRVPAHCTALGKVLLAFADEDFPADGPPLVGLTARTVIDRGTLRKALQEVRRTAIAYDYEESMAGLCCVAMPVFGANGRVLAALSVSMPVGEDLTPVRAAPLLRIAARAMSRTLSNQPTNRRSSHRMR